MSLSNIVHNIINSFDCFIWSVLFGKTKKLDKINYDQTLCCDIFVMTSIWAHGFVVAILAFQWQTLFQTLVGPPLKVVKQLRIKINGISIIRKCLASFLPLVWTQYIE